MEGQFRRREQVGSSERRRERDVYDTRSLDREPLLTSLNDGSMQHSSLSAPLACTLRMSSGL